jgi:hypothetical protein
MYYKITNKECEVYKKLHEMRTKEIQYSKENWEAIEDKAGVKFTKFFGYHGQQTFGRVPEYMGFVFDSPELLTPKIWVREPNNEGVFIPNKRTKLGREMSNFLLNGLKKSYWGKPLEILGLERINGRFTFPYVEIVGEIIIIYLDEQHQPKDENIIEITKKEFELIGDF